MAVKGKEQNIAKKIILKYDIKGEKSFHWKKPISSAKRESKSGALHTMKFL